MMTRQQILDASDMIDALDAAQARLRKRLEDEKRKDRPPWDRDR